jgi:hypothetical protein
MAIVAGLRGARTIDLGPTAPPMGHRSLCWFQSPKQWDHMKEAARTASRPPKHLHNYPKSQP